MYNYCTLFDSGYLDKGLVLYESLVSLPEKIHLYVFAFDEKAYVVLKKLNFEHMTVISLADFETPELLKVKKERTRAEYCWTCTPCTIEYVLNNFSVDMCTYIDADMMFFSSAKPIFDDMESAKASIIITPHRFDDSPKDKETERIFGRYCVEFNTFKKDERGMTALVWWKERCLEWCFYEKDGDRLGDQKYLDGWTTKFEGVYESTPFGAGLAPWNTKQCELTSANDLEVTIMQDKKQWQVIFYHYQSLRYLGNGFVNLNSGTKNKKLKQALYFPYLSRIEKVREMLKKNYDIEIHTSRAISKNKFIAWVQNSIMRFRLKSLSDLVNLNNL